MVWVVMVGAAMLGYSLWVNRRIRRTSMEVHQRRMLVAMVWIAPGVGALFGHLQCRIAEAEQKATSPEAHAVQALPGWVDQDAPVELQIEGLPAFAWSEHQMWLDPWPSPDWNAVHAWADASGSDTVRVQALAAAQRAWLLHMRDAMGPHFALYESETEWVLSSLEPAVARASLNFMAKTRRRVAQVLSGMAEFGPGQHSILVVMDDEDGYYGYLSARDSAQGATAFSSGVYLSGPCPHFLVRRADLSAIEPIIAHEMTHSALGHLSLPLWLNEGLAINTEHRLTGVPITRYIGRQRHEQHRVFWGHAQVQQFWSGVSFLRPDEGNTLSYDLARILVEQLAKDWDCFVRFVCRAHHDDAGAAAARDEMGVDLGKLVSVILEQEESPDWAPQPQAWPFQPAPVNGLRPAG